jgi:predicted DsbA family dithiol-disulfide isomerase
MSARHVLAIDFYVDLVCPWCWIGLRQLRGAQQRLRLSHPELELEVNWCSLPLLPQLPRAGVPYLEFYLRRLGGPAALAQRRAKILAHGRGIVPQIDFDRIATMPNTVLAHRMLAWARPRATPAQLTALLEALFQAFFVEGRDIGDAATLEALAATQLHDTGRLRAWLDDEEGWTACQQAAMHPPLNAVGGVPCLVPESGVPLSGVTSVDYLHHWLANLMPLSA